MADDRFVAPPPHEARRLETLARVVDLFRAQEPKITSSYMAAFLAVARNPGKGPTEYAKMCGTIQPIMSRMLLEIGIKARTRDNALGLVDFVVDREDLRNKKYHLSPKGRILYRQIVEAMGGIMTETDDSANEGKGT